MIAKRSLLLISLFLTPSLFASDLGITGLFDIPTARMRPDGEFSARISKQPLVDIYSLSYQATPWLETSFRYSAFPAIGFYDRSYEVKLRLLKESVLLPEVSAGIRDLLGTGAFGAEYLVASKSYGDWDLSIGLGWGRFSDRSTFSNPLSQLSDRFTQRDTDTGVGGNVQFGSFFSGPDVGLFGGVAYKVPGSSVRLLGEYSSDAYETEKAFGIPVENSSPFSFGAEWEITQDVKFAGSRQFGDQWAFSISSTINSGVIPDIQPIHPFISSIDLAASPANNTGRSFETWYERLLYDTERSGLRLYEAKSNATRTELSLVIANTDYPLAADAVNKFLDLAELHLPSSYRSLNIILNEGGIQPITLSYLRNGFAGVDWVPRSPSQVEILSGRELIVPDDITTFDLGRLAFSANLGTRIQVFDPDNPFRHQVNLKLGASSRLGWDWFLRSTYIVDIDNNFDEIVRGSNSVLPHVRSDIDLYLKEGISGLQSLYLDRKDNLSSDVFYRLYGGVLEEMYSGVGGEILYQPFRSRLAYGFSMNWVKQRDYDKSFNHLDYSTVTAFASIYWATPFYNYDIAIHAGQFLAKDMGAKFEIRRTMDNGWVLGAWATLTDVPFEDFGEGSFDKGIFLKIPLQGVLPGNTRSSYSTAIRSIQRDGGQLLENYSGTLWHSLRSTRYDALDNNRARMIADYE